MTVKEEPVPEKINWSYSMQVASGPVVTAADVIDAEAYDKLSVTIGAGKTEEVDMAPGGAMLLLVVNPAKPDEKLTYKVAAADVPLDGPLVLVGAGAIGLLGKDVSALSFTNGTAADAEIEILVARDAVK